VLREAKAATHRVFDPATKQLIEVPDHKTRLAAITLELAYTEGRPIERQLVATGKFTDFQSVIERVKSSPVVRAALGDVIDVDSLQSGQNVTNQERPTHCGSSETEPTPSAEK
jgi:hypothetical protein